MALYASIHLLKSSGFILSAILIISFSRSFSRVFWNRWACRERVMRTRRLLAGSCFLSSTSFTTSLSTKAEADDFVILRVFATPDNVQGHILLILNTACDWVFVRSPRRPRVCASHTSNTERSRTQAMRFCLRENVFDVHGAPRYITVKIPLIPQ